MPAAISSYRTTTKWGNKMDKLTMDTIAAQRAGMSYGRYKAIHPQSCPSSTEIKPIAPPEPPKPGPVIVSRPCARCRKMFEVDSKNRRRYCSPECAAAAIEESRRESARKRRAAEKAERHQEGKLCKICGKRFYPENMHSLFCGPECKAESRRRSLAKYNKTRTEE